MKSTTLPRRLKPNALLMQLSKDLGEPESAWLEDMHSNKKWDYSIVEDEEGRIRLVD
mgnify:CR=1 FL=1